ncbi:MAG: chromate transporter [Erysipelotrichaceae bacterium]|nr:chromate transporter [Erysipelotrichaceae bacterium]MDY5252836.1 chromate transporter [Erysipelotrichaceae bacterium]
MIYLKLLLAFFQIGLFSFGGGYASIALIQQQVVELNQWLTMSEFTDLITISQMTPGPIAINGATFVGTKIAGVFGSVVATVGCILPSSIIVGIITVIYVKYHDLKMVQSVLKSLRPAIVAMIASSGLSILLTAIYPNASFNFAMIGIFVVVMIVQKFSKLGPISIMLLAGILNLLLHLF